MNCADMCIDTGYDEENEFHSARVVRAAKPHECRECGSSIAAGEQYEYVAARSEARMWTVKTCLACVEIRNTFCCGGWIYGELWQGVREQLFHRWEKNLFGVECLARLKSDAAVAKMRERYEDWRFDAR